MHSVSIASAALLLFSMTPALAQEWLEFVSREDGFAANFPGEPEVTETTSTSEYGANLPSRVYSVARGEERYSVTVVDCRPVEQLLTEKAKECAAQKRMTMPAIAPISSSAQAVLWTKNPGKRFSTADE